MPNEMPVKRQQEIATECGWNRVDEKVLNVSVPLTDVEKVQMGDELAGLMEQVQSELAELKLFAKGRKQEIQEVQDHAERLARQIRSRRKDVEVKAVGFFDPKEQVRIYLDPETEEVLHRGQAEEGDGQMRIA